MTQLEPVHVVDKDDDDTDVELVEVGDYVKYVFIEATPNDECKFAIEM